MKKDSKKTKGLIRHFVLMAIFCGLLLPLSASAQKGVVKGTVKDSNGELLMGAGVVVKGTTLYRINKPLSQGKNGDYYHRQSGRTNVGFGTDGFF